MYLSHHGISWHLQFTLIIMFHWSFAVCTMFHWSCSNDSSHTLHLLQHTWTNDSWLLLTRFLQTSNHRQPAQSTPTSVIAIQYPIGQGGCFSLCSMKIIYYWVKKIDPDVTRTRSLLIWSQTRYQLRHGVLVCARGWTTLWLVSFVEIDQWEIF